MNNNELPRMLITDVIKDQIKDIYKSGEVNMFNFAKVRRIAESKKYAELVQLMEESSMVYLKYILFGDRSEY